MKEIREFGASNAHTKDIVVLEQDLNALEKTFDPQVFVGILDQLVILRAKVRPGTDAALHASLVRTLDAHIPTCSALLDAAAPLSLTAAQDTLTRLEQEGGLFEEACKMRGPRVAWSSIVARCRSALPGLRQSYAEFTFVDNMKASVAEWGASDFAQELTQTNILLAALVPDSKRSGLVNDVAIAMLEKGLLLLPKCPHDGLVALLDVVLEDVVNSCDRVADLKVVYNALSCLPEARRVSDEWLKLGKTDLERYDADLVGGGIKLKSLVQLHLSVQEKIAATPMPELADIGKAMNETVVSVTKVAMWKCES